MYGKLNFLGAIKPPAVGMQVFNRWGEVGAENGWAAAAVITQWCRWNI